MPPAPRPTHSTRSAWRWLAGPASQSVPPRARAGGQRQRLVHGGVAARIAIEDDLRARRQRAAPEGGGERGDPGVGDLVCPVSALTQLCPHSSAPFFIVKGLYLGQVS